MSVGTLLIVLLIAAWLLQLALAHRQARMFLRTVNELRAGGTTAVGVSGKGWGRPRTYVALSTGADGRVRSARQLRGVTVWARPTDVPELRGRALADLVDPPKDDDPAAKAAAMAARTLLDASRPDEGAAERGADASSP